MQHLDPIVMAMWEEELERCSCLSCRFLRADMRQLKLDLVAALTRTIEGNDDAE